MHPALRLREITQLIAKNTQSDKPTLCALAITCRSFSEPALDALWEEIQTIVPLFLALPKDLFTEDRRTMVWGTRLANGNTLNLTYRLARDVTATDWAIFCKYAARVKVITHGIEDQHEDKTSNRAALWADEYASVRLLLDTMERLATETPSPLFPRLRELQWRSCDVQTCAFLRVISSPSITTLFVEGGPSYNNGDETEDEDTLAAKQAETLNVLSNLGVLCPRIKSFRWLDHSGNSTPTSALSQAVCDWQHLEHLEVGILLTDAALAHLSQLPSLRSLQMNPHLRSSMSGRVLPLKGRVFSSLVSLELRDDAMQDASSSFYDATWLLQSIGGQISSRGFSVSTHSIASSPDIPALIEAISKYFAHETLTSLTLHENLYFTRMMPMQDDQTRLDTYSVTFTSLQPVLCFEQIESVVLDLERMVTLSNSEMLTLSQAWPRLRVLRINSQHGWPAPGSRITFAGLAAMLAALPCIEDVAIAIDGSTAPLDGAAVVDVTSGAYRTPSSLKSLDLLNSSKGDQADDAAMSLLRILSDVHSCDLRACKLPKGPFGGVSGGEEPARWWKDVFEALKAMHPGVTAIAGQELKTVGFSLSATLDELQTGAQN